MTRRRRREEREEVEERITKGKDEKINNHYPY